MRLTQPSGPPRRAGKAPAAGRRALTTEAGFVNPNRQVVIRATGARSTTRDAQSIYALRCRDCGNEYGCNGLDIKERRCPACQGGAPGEPVPEPSPMLFPE